MAGTFVIDLEMIAQWIALLSAVGGAAWGIVRGTQKVLNEIRQIGGEVSDLKAFDQKTRAKIEHLTTEVGAIREANQASMRIALDKMCYKTMNSGCITLFEKERIALMFENYSALGGNHGMSEKVKACLALPTVKERKDNND